jgi:mRNA interferase MazF
MIRGEIYWANLLPRSGSEQSGKRPVLIISHDGFNETPDWRSIIVIPLSTSERQARRGPTAVLLPRGVAGLSQSSVALCHQITTLDRSKLTQRIGTLPPRALHEVEAGVRAALDLA